MINLCISCNRILESGDVVKATIISEYLVLPSKQTYALSKDMTCEPDSLRHFDCQYPKGEEILDGD